MGQDLTPVVLVQGFLATGGLVAWEHHINKYHGDPGRQRKILVPSIGPVSSLHDRACELYYALVGGTVDYGEEHSRIHKHARFGRTLPRGLYPQWSTARPLHFVGHSIGGSTIIKLQHLLHKGHFGDNSHPDMILSVNSVCSPFRGTQATYILGESTTSAPNVRALSVGAGISKLVHLLAYLSPLLPSTLDVHADARSLSYRHASLSELVSRLWTNDWAASHDAAPYDVTFQAAQDREDEFEGRAFPNTFYRSHVAFMTTKRSSSADDHKHRPRIDLCFATGMLYFISKAIGAFDYTSLKPTPSFCDEDGVPMCHKERTHTREEYWANDGVVPLFSQWHPLPCSESHCDHHAEHRGEKPSEKAEPKPGVWTIHTSQANHLALIPGPLTDVKYQRRFWSELGLWLDAIDASSS